MRYIVFAIALIATVGCSTGTYRPPQSLICSQHDPQCEVVAPRTPSPMPW